VALGLSVALPVATLLAVGASGDPVALAEVQADMELMAEGVPEKLAAPAGEGVPPPSKKAPALAVETSVGDALGELPILGVTELLDLALRDTGELGLLKADAVAARQDVGDTLGDAEKDWGGVGENRAVRLRVPVGLEEGACGEGVNPDVAVASTEALMRVLVVAVPNPRGVLLGETLRVPVNEGSREGVAEGEVIAVAVAAWGVEVVL
jgi:hypothetical protein